MGERISDAVTLSEARLTEAGVPTPRVDAMLLLAHVLGVSRGEVETQLVLGRALSPAERARFEELVERRATREPVQHILGTVAFRHLELEVGPGVFVPRPETEFLTEVALEALNAHLREGASDQEHSQRVVDLCTGSGAIALAIASERPEAQVWGVELSEDALRWARRNLTRLSLSNVSLQQGDAAEALPDLNGRVALVVSNPPYIPEQAVPRDPEVRLYDPALALFGGADGLTVIRSVSATAQRLLEPGGSVVIEHGELQGEQVASILAADGFTAVHTVRDLSGRDRVTSGRR